MAAVSLAGRHAIVTGANGYIGNALTTWLQDRGCTVTALCRKRPAGLAPEATWLSWKIGDEIPAETWRGEDLVFHLAHDWSADIADATRSANCGAALHLLEAARKNNAVRVVIASSQQARPDTPSRYGRVKHAIEQLMTGPDEIPVRIGFVYGGDWGGPAGKLAEMARSAPLVPTPGGRARIRPVHIDDLCGALAEIAVSGWPNDELPFVAGPDCISLGTFVAKICKERFGSRRRYIPFPPGIFTLAAALIPPGVAPSLRDRLAGLGALATVGDMLPNNPRSCRFRTFDEGLADDRRRNG